jgi:hypothetical protein
VGERADRLDLVREGAEQVRQEASGVGLSVGHLGKQPRHRANRLLADLQRRTSATGRQDEGVRERAGGCEAGCAGQRVRSRGPPSSRGRWRGGRAEGQALRAPTAPAAAEPQAPRGGFDARSGSIPTARARSRGSASTAAVRTRECWCARAGRSARASIAQCGSMCSASTSLSCTQSEHAACRGGRGMNSSRARGGESGKRFAPLQRLRSDRPPPLH